MTAASASLSPTAAGALSAFLRGVERRALVVAELQTGDGARAEQALVAVMRAFAAVASDLPMAQWPPRFWALLAARQALRDTPTGRWEGPLAHLGNLEPLIRLALLLRIGAGLDEDTAARLLDTDVDGYQEALAAACPRDRQGNPDAQAWRGLAEQVQQQIRELPAQRLKELQQPVAAGRKDDAPKTWRAPAAEQHTPSAPPRRRSSQQRRWRGPAILLGTVLVLLLAGLGWRAWQGRVPDAPAVVPEGAVGEAGPVTVEALEGDAPKVAAAAADPMATEDAAMLADRDFPLLADADLHAWSAAGGPLPVDESQARPTRPEPVAAALETAAADE
ncbi:hypothetical protein H9654_05125 [Stenotrophomonas sp. Sa5BUN4]|uniref:Transmembrane protein n=1 Tax=Stenotrophomonas lacuserhaii TaxID=2760084 RepID=A0A8X8FZ52_9GAMM|nr:hypothetical protein [Stenotrophomonas pennii]MBD7953585.1 hypothetical protein [Stenotrophomonas pennii]